MKVNVPDVFAAWVVWQVTLDGLYMLGHFCLLVNAATKVMYEQGRTRGTAHVPGQQRPQFRSGEKAPVSGIYQTARGTETALTKGERFPPSRTGWSLKQAASTS